MSFPEGCFGSSLPVFTRPFSSSGVQAGGGVRACWTPPEMPWAPDSFWAGRCRGARMWLSCWCPGTFTVPAPSQQHLSPLGSPSSRLGRLALATGAGSPRHEPSLRWGSAGTQGVQSKQAQEAVAAGERARGTLGHTGQCARHALRAACVRQGGAGRGLRGQGPGRASEAGLQSCARDHGGSFWLLVGLVGAEGTAEAAEVGGGAWDARGMVEGWAASGALQGGARTGVRPQGRRSQDES